MDADYIVVGAGAAGGAMAARLSEDPAKRVLLLEAGLDHERVGANQGLPDALRYGYGNPGNGGPAETRGHHWYPDSNNPVAGSDPVWRGGLFAYTGDGEERHAVDLPRGRVIGGTTSVNSQMWVRGTLEDFEYWSTELGCGTWSFENVLPFFNSVETDVDYGTLVYHGDRGPMTVRRHPRDAWRAADIAWHEACLAAGFAHCEDMNAPGTRGGAGSLALNNVNRVRQSSALTFLAGARGRPNLEIRGTNEVLRVLFADEGGTPRAAGVELVDGTVIRARVEVILCGGAIGSPHILLRSGVGPASELRAAGIDPKVDLPVGRNLRDHVALPLAFRMRNDIASNNFDATAHPMPMHLRYTAVPCTGMAPLVNDMLIYLGPMQSAVGEQVRLAGHNSSGNRVMIMIPTLMLELSVGSLALPAPAPGGQPDLRAMPVIEMGWLSHPADRVRLREALRLALTLAASKEMAAVLEGPISPRADEVTHASPDAALDRWVARHVITSHHQSSTCRMGDPSDPAAVCDESGRVLGAAGLRVVDASLMPDCPRANTQATTYMMAERIARIINHGSLASALASARGETLAYAPFAV